jgi:hypothetical protein
MVNAGSLTFQDYAMREPLPLAEIHDAVLEFARHRDDVVIFGALAVNAYAGSPRMTQDVDLMAVNAGTVAEQLRSYLAGRFQIAVRARQVAGGRGLRLYQVRKAGNRHLVDVRPVDALPPATRIHDLLVMAPINLIASKVIAAAQRRGSPKAFTDMRDVAVLLLAFPDLKRDPGPVTEHLSSNRASDAALAIWRDLVAQDIHPEEDDMDFD